MIKYNPLHARDAHIWTLRILCVVFAVVTLVAILSLRSVPSEIKVRVPPNYAQGVLLEQNSFPKSAIYANSYVILQNLQNWPDDGEVDYTNNIITMRCYLYPEMQDWLAKDLSAKRIAGELSGRKRYPRLVGVYNQNNVTPVGNGVWHVYIDVEYNDYLHDEPFKTAIVRYPLTVATDERACNPLGIALQDVFAPVRRIDTEVRDAADKNKESS